MNLPAQADEPAKPSVWVRLLHPSIRNELVIMLALCVVATVTLLGWTYREFSELDQLTNEVNLSGRLRMLSQRVALLTLSAAMHDKDAQASLAVAAQEFERITDVLRQSDVAHSRDLRQQALAGVLKEWHWLREYIAQAVAAGRPLSLGETSELNRLAASTLKAAEDNVSVLLPIVESRRNVFSRLLPAGLVGGLVLLIGLALFVQRRLLAPLRALEQHFTRMSSGDLGARVTPRNDDEIGRLIRHANRSAESLEAAHARDVETLARLEDSEIRHRTLWEIASEAIITIDTSGTIMFANPAVERTFGYSPTALIGQNIALLQPAHLRDAHRGGLERYLASAQPKLDWRSIELNALHRNGHEFPVELSFSEMHLSKDHWFVGTFRDITERKRQQEALLYSANYDSLTSLPNRNLLMDRIEQAIHVCRRHARPFGLLYLDLDNFKFINDSLGHERGDELLCEASRRLLTCVRDGDTVARVGGDEFVLLLNEMAREDDIDAVAQRALYMMAQPFHVGESEGFVGVSIGGSLFPEDGTTRTELLQHADIAMYRAKEYGRNNFQRYAGHMQARYKLRMSMETQLRKAIAADELVLHYQPQIDLASGRVVGAEALIRWESPTLGRVSPAQFIPLAEETGLIVPIGAWVIERACRDAAGWLGTREGQGCHVAINLSARQFNEDNLIEAVSAAIAENCLPPERVELEITESLVMANPERASSALQALKQIGCKVALDDFGTGYSSLAYLRSFPLDCLKIDKSLISDVAIVRAVIQLARSFGLKTLAEGVEDEAVLHLLKHLGCDLIQGYYYSRPLPLGEFRSYLLAHDDAMGVGPHASGE